MANGDAHLTTLISVLDIYNVLRYIRTLSLILHKYIFDISRLHRSCKYEVKSHNQTYLQRNIAYLTLENLKYNDIPQKSSVHNVLYFLGIMKLIHMCHHCKCRSSPFQILFVSIIPSPMRIF